MTETTMPVTEAQGVAGSDEQNSYEFAFHILPTVAEGEVAGVFDAVKAHITKAGGECFDEEMTERIDLVYPIVKHLEGKNRKFTSAYFGWIRFRLEGEKIADLTEELSHEMHILRHLMIKLTRIEEANPFRFHEHRKSLKQVEVVDEEAGTLKETQTEEEEAAEVSEEQLDESLEKITGDDTIEDKSEKA